MDTLNLFLGRALDAITAPRQAEGLNAEDDGAPKEAEDIVFGLLADVAAVAEEFTEIESRFGIPAALIREPPGNLSSCQVLLSIVTTAVPYQLRRIWGLSETDTLSFALDNILRSGYRQGEEPAVVVYANYEEQPTDNAIALTLGAIATYHVRNNWATTATAGESTSDNFLLLLYQMIEMKLMWLANDCIVCGNAIIRPGILPSKCESAVCAQEMEHFGKISLVPRISPDVMDLFQLFFLASGDRGYPAMNTMAFHIEVMKSSFWWYFSSSETTVRTLREHIPCPRKFLSCPQEYAKFQEKSPQVARMCEWIANSSSALIERIPKNMRLPFLETEHQFIFVSDNRDKQNEWDGLLKEHGETHFYFHGSAIANWHSIVRGGLKVMSGTAGQKNGAKYGRGIYMSQHLSMAMGFSNYGDFGNRAECLGKQCCQLSNKITSRFYAVALLEVIKTKDFLANPTKEIVVCSDAKYCSIRMILLFDDAQRTKVVKTNETQVHLLSLTRRQKEEIVQVSTPFIGTTVEERAKLWWNKT